MKDSELSADYIVPTVFNPSVMGAVADAVGEVARASIRTEAPRPQQTAPSLTLSGAMEVA